MNTNDFEVYDFHPQAMEEVFEKQHNLFELFKKIEPNSPEDFDINCYEDQVYIKDFMFRFMEELTEATVDWDYRDHFYEELLDSFNFLTLIFIIYDWNDKNLPTWDDKSVEDKMIFWEEEGTKAIIPDVNGLKAKFYDVIEATGYAANLLKNRPWKQCQYMVDLYWFEPRMREIWAKFNSLCDACGLSLKRLYEIWSQKYQCNVFRMDTGY